MTNFNFFGNNSIIVKKSPVVIAKTFVALQMTTMAVFFFAGVLADYGEIYKDLPLAGTLSFHIAEVIGIFFFETVLVFYIFFAWYKEYYDLRPDKIIHGKGIIFRQKNVVSLKTIHSVSYRQGPLGRLTRYGNIDLEDSISNGVITLDHIPEPQKYTEWIMHVKESLADADLNLANNSIENLIAGGEHEKLEFKKSFRWDFNQNKVNKNLEKSVMKSIAAFLNSDGGSLIIGADDSGNITGLDQDYHSLPKSGRDGFQNHFTNVFHAMIGPEFRQFVDMAFYNVGGKECCLVRAAPVNKPAYLKSENSEEFFIRTGNGTTALKLSEVASYIDSRWRGKLL